MYRWYPVVAAAHRADAVKVNSGDPEQESLIARTPDGHQAPISRHTDSLGSGLVAVVPQPESGAKAQKSDGQNAKIQTNVGQRPTTRKKGGSTFIPMTGKAQLRAKRLARGDDQNGFCILM